MVHLAHKTNSSLSEEESGRDYVVISLRKWHDRHNAEGAVAINSQAKEPDLDDTLESNGAPKK